MTVRTYDVTGGTASEASSFYRDGAFLYDREGTSLSYKKADGSHCGGMEDVAYATRRAGNL